LTNINDNQKTNREKRTAVRIRGKYDKGIQGSISTPFYMPVFHIKVHCEAFLYTHFGYVTFWQEDICKKSVWKMLMKLTPVLIELLYFSTQYLFVFQSGVNFMNILLVPFVLIFLGAKNFKAAILQQYCYF